MDNLNPPPSAQPATAEDRFVFLVHGLADKLRGVTARVNDGTLTFDAAILAVEELFVKFPPELHRLAESVKDGRLPSGETK